jgi:geranylgeranyl diphosphate synthase, type II
MSQGAPHPHPGAPPSVASDRGMSRPATLAAELPALDFTVLPAFLAGASAWMNRALPRYLPEGEPADFLYDPARDYPQRGGKRFRPALLLLCAALGGGDPRSAVPSAVALELFQNFALVHDDIEDGSLVRRGKPALHLLHGIPLAINVGDLLFGLVYEALLDNQALFGAEKALAVQREFAEVFRRTFEGQALDIGWIRAQHWPVRAEFETMIRLKTGWYSGRGPCRIGAGLGGAPPESVAALGDYGEQLGLGFQVRDDLLNLTEDSSGAAPEAGGAGGGYGKERGGDIAEGKRTLIVIEMLERLTAAEATRVRSILALPPSETPPDDIEWVIGQAERCGALDAVRRQCRAHSEAALAALQRLPSSPHRALLAELAGYLTQERNT